MKTISKFLLALLFSFILFLPSNLSSAEEQCMSRKNIISRVKNNLNLKMFTLGIIENGWILEVIIAKNKNWTMFGSSTDGRSCVLGKGTNWVYPLPFGINS